MKKQTLADYIKFNAYYILKLHIWKVHHVGRHQR